VVIDLANRSVGLGRVPHGHDVAGWRRWLKEQGIGRVHGYQPDKKARGILGGAAWLGLDIEITLTGEPSDSSLEMLRLLGRRVRCFNCVGTFVEGRLCGAGIEADKLHVAVPEVEPRQVSSAERQKWRDRLKGGSSPALVLALARPDNPQGLRMLAWSGALLQYMIGPTKVVVAGSGTREDWRCLRQWERMWQREHLFCGVGEAVDWDVLAAACDVVAVGDKQLREVIRLLHARAAGCSIMAGRGVAEEFLVGYDRAHLVSPGKPREWAGCLLGLVEAGKEKMSAQ